MSLGSAQLHDTTEIKLDNASLNLSLTTPDEIKVKNKEENIPSNSYKIQIDTANEDIENNHTEPITDINDQNITLNIQDQHHIPPNNPFENYRLMSSLTSQLNPQMNPLETLVFSIALPELKIYLKKLIGFLAAMIITSLCILLPLVDSAYFIAVSIVPLFYCIFCIAIDISEKIKTLKYLYIDTGDFFNTLDAFNIILLIVTLQLKTTGVISGCSYASIPFLMEAYGYIYFSKNVLKKWNLSMITRFCYATQVTFLVLELDENLDWDWESVFNLILIMLKIKIGLYIGSMLVLLGKLTIVSQPRRFDIKTIGCFLWWLLYQGLIVLPFLVIYGFIQYQSDLKDFELMNIAAYIGLGMGIFLLVTVLLAKDSLLEFIVKMNLVKSLQLEYENGQKTSTPREVIVLEKEKKEELFVMQSSTYFIPLHETFSAKGKENINKIKGIFSKFRRTKKNKPAQKAINQSSMNIKNANTLDLEDNSSRKGDKLALSLVDIDLTEYLEEVPRKPKANNAEENSCYMCYMRPRNVVLRPCGHGGVCFDCLVSHLKQNSKCMECRAKIEGVFKVESSPKIFDIVRGHEFYKFTTKTTNAM